MSQQKKAFISSTSIDLQKHREQVTEACQRMGYLPVGMETWPAQDADAETVCLREVDDCELFIGFYAFRYGWIPEGQEKSITELEYDRAVAQGKARLLFFADIKGHWPLELVDMDENGATLKAFKQRIGAERVSAFFTTPNDLRGLVIHALTEHAKPADAADDLRPVEGAIPLAPAPYIAHPYSLMQSRRLVGRTQELSMLTDWVAKPGSAIYECPMLSLVAIGGMGKSALTWHFFERIVPQEMPQLAGRMWWSFYEREATFERFVAHALAYCSGQALEAVERLDYPTQQDQLWQHLDRRPFLLVLDGLERALVAYNRLDAGRMLDDDLDEATANQIATAAGLPESAGETYLARHRLRQCTDPRSGRLLQGLTRLHASRVLITSRLYPAELQTRTGHPLPGSAVRFQRGLAPNDALTLWRDLGISGARDELLPLFASFDQHPLLLQALAGEVADWRPEPGDFSAWRQAHPGFDPAAQLDLRQRQSHILLHALAGLGEAPRRVLHTLAGLRMATGYPTLSALLVGEAVPCPDPASLDRTLAELEDRGLLGWERAANRYDLHPIVRGVVWGTLEGGERETVLHRLHDHIRAQPLVEDWQQVESLADLAPAIELYDKLIGLRQWQAAYELFADRIEQATLWRLGAARRRLELLRPLFADPENDPPQGPPRLAAARQQSWTLNALALAYQLSGRPGAAVGLFQQAAAIDEREGDQGNLTVDLYNLSDAQRLSGGLHGAEGSARRALGLARGLGHEFREAVSLFTLGLALTALGDGRAAAEALGRSEGLFQQQRHQQFEGVVVASRAEFALHQGQAAEALALAERAVRLAQVRRHERDLIRAARLQGTAALHLGDKATADERLHHALHRARAIDLAEEELPALCALAELRRRQGDAAGARELLDQIREPAERGPYPLFHADALNLLAQIERDAGNSAEAIAAATEAYRKAWCDGPPYAYHWGLEAAREHLRELGAPEPAMPPFDPSKHEPMPEVEIEPKTQAKRKARAKGKKGGA